MNGIIQNPGKFEGCHIYVPYFWEIGMNGLADRDNGQVYGFDITAEDKAIWPELNHRRTIKLFESEIGFVYELQ